MPQGKKYLTKMGSKLVMPGFFCVVPWNYSTNFGDFLSKSVSGKEKNISSALFEIAMSVRGPRIEKASPNGGDHLNN